MQSARASVGVFTSHFLSASEYPLRPWSDRRRANQGPIGQLSLGQSTDETQLGSSSRIVSTDAVPHK